MAEREFIQSGTTGPRLKYIFKIFNSYTSGWIVSALLLTAAYGYFFQYEFLQESGPVKLALTLGGEFLLALLITGLITLYIYDKRQTDMPIQRVFPVVIWGRKFLVKVGPLLRQYLFSNDQEETPYNRITRNWIYATSAGVSNTIGFGSQIDMDKVGTTLIMPATFTNTKTKTGDETGHFYKKVIGEHTGVQTYTLKHFVHISAMSYGALSYNAHAALSKGAKMAGILHNTGEGSLAPCHEYGGADLVFQIGTAKYGIRTEDGNMDDNLLKEMADHPQVKMFEIKLAQGAKPGKGGMLLKEKSQPKLPR